MSASQGDYMRGTVEIISNGISTGMVVNLRDADAVPVVVEAGQSLTDVVPVDVPRDGVDAEWTAVTEDGFPAEVLWREDRDVVPDVPAGDETED